MSDLAAGWYELEVEPAAIEVAPRPQRCPGEIEVRTLRSVEEVGGGGCRGDDRALAVEQHHVGLTEDYVDVGRLEGLSRAARFVVLLDAHDRGVPLGEGRRRATAVRRAATPVVGTRVQPTTNSTLRVSDLTR